MSRRANGQMGTTDWVGIRKGWDAVSKHPWPYLVRVGPRQLATHGLVVGATGSGKSNLLHHLIAQDLRRGHGVIVLDMRGDMVRAATELCAGLVHPSDAFVLDLRDGANVPTFNPLAGAGEPYFRALAVLDLIASEHDTWGVQLAETLRYALLLLAGCGEPLARIEHLFHRPGFLAGCVARCRCESTRAFWQRYDVLPDDRKASLATPVLNKVSLLLATPAIRRVLGSGQPFDLAGHLDTPGSVTLVSLATDQTHGAGRMLGRLMLSSLCREFFARVSVPMERRVPVRLYVDEFENFGFADFEALLAEGRKYGVGLVLAHQTLAQLSAKMRSLLLNGVGLKAYFRTGRDDSAALSRDVTGNPKAIDLTSLRTGEAVFWSKGSQPFVLEVNEPIVRDTGTPSSRAASFLRAVHARPEYRTAPEAEPETVSAQTATARKARQGRPGARLEDWLCG